MRPKRRRKNKAAHTSYSPPRCGAAAPFFRPSRTSLPGRYSWDCILESRRSRSFELKASALVEGSDNPALVMSHPTVVKFTYKAHKAACPILLALRKLRYVAKEHGRELVG